MLFCKVYRDENPSPKLSAPLRLPKARHIRYDGNFLFIQDPLIKRDQLSHNHHFKWWFGLALIRADYMLAQKGGYRKHCYWSAYKAVLLESSFLDSSACSLIYFFIASSVILSIVET